MTSDLLLEHLSLEHNLSSFEEIFNLVQERERSATSARRHVKHIEKEEEKESERGSEKEKDIERASEKEDDKEADQHSAPKRKRIDEDPPFEPDGPKRKKKEKKESKTGEAADAAADSLARWTPVFMCHNS